MNFKRYVLPATVIFSTILLQMWALHSGRLINVDGILYLRSAHAFLIQQYEMAQNLSRWPFYSLLIALFSDGLSISLTLAAYLLNGLFQVLLALTLVHFIKQLGGNRRCQWFLFILLSVHPYLNDYRSFIMPDFGYWAFFFIGLSGFTRAFRAERLLYAFGGGLALCVCMAFRVESVVFIILFPFAFLLNRRFKWQHRILYSGMAWLPLLMTVLAWISLMLYWGQWHLSHLKQFIHLTHAIPTIRENVSSLVFDMKTNVLDYQAQHGASVIVIGGLLVLMLFEMIKVTNPFFFLITLYSAKRHFMPKSEGKRLCQYALLINLSILLYFVGTFTFLSGRYVMPISLLLLLWAPFAIEHAYQYFCVFSSKSLKYWYYPGILGVFIGCFMYSLSHWHYDKLFIRDASQWTKDHVEKQHRLVSNSAEYLFYSRGVFEPWDQSFYRDVDMVFQRATRQDIIAVKLNKKQALKILPKLENYTLLATFQNKRSDRVLIIQKNI